jgi:hypothetical protein
MGNAGKWRERERARELRARSWTLQEIADELGVAKGSVSVWVRDVEFTPRPRNRGHPSGSEHPMRKKRLAEIAQCHTDAVHDIGALSSRDLMMFALALYAGEGSKSEGSVIFANSDPLLARIFVTWMRTQFVLDEHRFRVRLYLHDDLDLEHAVEHWSTVLDIPPAQFTAPYRAACDPTMRRNRHVDGCASVIYHSRLIHRRVMAMIAAVGSAFADPG